jgi:hypothetical protein
MTIDLKLLLGCSLSFTEKIRLIDQWYATNNQIREIAKGISEISCSHYEKHHPEDKRLRAAIQAAVHVRRGEIPLEEFIELKCAINDIDPYARAAAKYIICVFYAKYDPAGIVGWREYVDARTYLTCRILDSFPIQKEMIDFLINYFN